uniref:Protein arginine N-methyltransferase domain-containing protein n=1 Tax=Chromera velia CCMP2878 TaxID=1169474 RepID=A0A0G4G7J9_9ALVE|eukprot:Cvel_20615.t1-p1 / transcript=Cvel_20615.t1 / gene=Cvel_20615 / organism=Chromera_velia_CCMP2878 / gene_product=HNRNP arginine N-methyltransferase, putative / transcript_product=HNRNP arginine N-methyltransferase, putative / location=Cvel_scaffold1866:2453-8311(+) / protein_length=714 / sequence_SO=supercontig / SO=protein_coding / is_pseudo=false
MADPDLSDGSDDWEGQESDEELDLAFSIFDDFSAEDSDAVWNHMKDKCGLDLSVVSKQLTQSGKEFDEYARMTLVNYLRKHAVKNDAEHARQLVASIGPQSAFWEDEEYLKPQIGDDRLLWDDFKWSSSENSSETGGGTRNVQETQPNAAPKTAGAAAAAAAAGASVSGAPPSGHHAFKDKVLVEEMDPSVLDQAEKVRNLMAEEGGGEQETEGKGVNGKPSGSSSSSSNPPAVPKGEGGGWRGRAVLTKTGDFDLSGVFEKEDDVGYFESYAHDDIHRTMLRDRVRTLSYQRFILGNPDVFKDKIVVDVGCGSGILSMFAVQAGAKKVVALEAAPPMAEKARKVVKANGFEDQISIFCSKVEELHLLFEGDPSECRVRQATKEEAEAAEASQSPAFFRCDAVVSEWMGYCLFYENMLFSVINVRDRWLRDGGMMVPNVCTVGAQTLNMMERLQEDLYAFGNKQDTYGLDLSLLNPPAARVFHTPEVIDVEQRKLTSTPLELCRVDLNHASSEQIRGFRVPFDLDTDNKTDTATSLCLYFDIIFHSSRKFEASKVGGPEVIYMDPASDGHDALPYPPRGFSSSSKGKGMRYFQTGGPDPWKTQGGEGNATSWGESGKEAGEEKGQPKSTTVTFSTSASFEPTHWKQTVLHLHDPADPKPLSLSADGTEQKLTGFLSIAPNSKHSRHIDIAVEVREAWTDMGKKLAPFVNFFELH